jgi:hypothetical protein
MPERLQELIAGIYQSFCNELTGRNWFDVPSLEETLKEINSMVNISV